MHEWDWYTRRLTKYSRTKVNQDMEGIGPRWWVLQSLVTASFLYFLIFQSFLWLHNLQIIKNTQLDISVRLYITCWICCIQIKNNIYVVRLQNNVGNNTTYLGTTYACQISVSRVNQMAGTEFMAKPNKEIGHLPLAYS